MLINYPYKYRLEPTEEQEKRLYHYGFTCRFIYNHALDQRNLSRDPNPVRIMNKTIKFLCWITVIVILSEQMTSGAGEETLTKPDGSKYVGEYKDNKAWNGTVYDKDGNVESTVSNGVYL